MQPTPSMDRFQYIMHGQDYNHKSAQSIFIAFEFGTIIGHVLVKYTISNLDQVHKNSYCSK